MKGINSKTLTVAGLLGIGALGALAPAQAAPNRDVRDARRDVKEARKDVRQERKDIRKADTPRERREETREYQRAQEELRRQQAQLQRERAQNRNNSNWNNRPANRPAWNNRPGTRPAWNNRPVGNYNNGANRTFTGYALATNSSGDLMQVRASNGTTYTVRTTAYVYKGQRLRVSGVLINGIIENASISRI